MDPFIGGGIVFGIIWLIAALTERKPRRRPPVLPPELAPPPPPPVVRPPAPPPPPPVVRPPAPPAPRPRRPPAPAGISWAGRTFADGGAWRAYVRPIYGPTLASGDPVGQKAATVMTLLAREGETGAHLRALNNVHKAWTSPEALAAIARTAGVV